MANKRREVKKKDVTNEIVTREFTINLHKRIHGV
jgi:large subunit ribosomal protein L31e